MCIWDLFLGFVPNSKYIRLCLIFASLKRKQTIWESLKVQIFFHKYIIHLKYREKLILVGLSVTFRGILLFLCLANSHKGFYAFEEKLYDLWFSVVCSTSFLNCWYFLRPCITARHWRGVDSLHFCVHVAINVF